MYATINVVKKPVNVVKMLIFVSKLFISKKLNKIAPAIVGIDSIKENFAASVLLKPKNNAAVIAVPDLEAPDIRLKH
tara:strand:+ start:296 stop:526 length:231 start_codon:yes stop_codon:yes gene_type:complete